MPAPLLTDILPAVGPACRIALGTVQAITGSTVTIDQAGQAVTGVPFIASYSPRVGDTVMILRQQERSWIVGAVHASARPATGTVTAVTASNVTVSTAIGSLTIPYVANAPSVGQVGVLMWHGGQSFYIGTLSTAPTTPAPPAVLMPPPAPTDPVITVGTTRFPAIQSATWRDEWRTDTDNVTQGTYPGLSAQHGAFFYGRAIMETLKGATCTGVSIRLVRDPDAGLYEAQTVHLRAHVNIVKPTGVDISYAAGGPFNAAVSGGEPVEFALPTSVGQALIDVGGGIATTSADPYLALLGLSRDGSSGRLTLNWSRI